MWDHTYASFSISITGMFPEVLPLGGPNARGGTYDAFNPVQPTVRYYSNNVVILTGMLAPLLALLIDVCGLGMPACPLK